MIVKILIVVVAAAIVGGTGVGLGVSTNVNAGTARTRADALLQRVDSDTSQINGALQEPGVPEFQSSDSHPDFKGARQRFDSFQTLVDRTRSTTAADAARLRAGDDQLRAYTSNLLALPVRSSLDREERRVAAMRSAFTEADLAMAVERDQARTLSAVMDAMDDLATIGDRFRANDPVGGIAMLSGLDGKLQSADQLAKAKDNPIQIELLIGDVRSFVQQLQSLLQAAQRNDVRAEQSLASQLDGDTQQYDELTNQLGFYENQIYQVHVDLYHEDLKAAGFTYPTGTRF